MACSNRHWRQVGRSPLHFVLRFRQDSHALATLRLFLIAVLACRGTAGFPGTGDVIGNVDIAMMPLVFFLSCVCVTVFGTKHGLRAL